MGHVKFVAFYLLGGARRARRCRSRSTPGSTVPTIGASGAIAAVLGGYILLYPRARVVTLIFIIFFFTIVELPAMIVLGLLVPAAGRLRLRTDLANPTGGGGGVAYFAHIGGFAFGLLAIKLFASRDEGLHPAAEVPRVLSASVPRSSRPRSSFIAILAALTVVAAIVGRRQRADARDAARARPARRRDRRRAARRRRPTTEYLMRACRDRSRLAAACSSADATPPLPPPSAVALLTSGCGGQRVERERRQARRRHDRRADHEHRRGRRRRPGDDHGHRPGGHELATRSSRRRASPSCSRTADVVFVNGLKLEEPTHELAEQNKKDGAEIVELGTDDRSRSPTTSTTSRSRRRTASRTRTCGPTRRTRSSTPRSSATTLAERDPANADLLRRELRARSPRKVDRARRRAADDVRDDPARQAQAADLPRRVRLLRPKTTAGTSSARSRRPTSRTRRRRRSPPSSTRSRQTKVPTIFGSEVFPSPVLEQIGKETGVRYEDSLRDDDLPGEPGDAEHSWLGPDAVRLRHDDRGARRRRDRAEGLDARRRRRPTRADYPQ